MPDSSECMPPPLASPLPPLPSWAPQSSGSCFSGRDRPVRLLCSYACGSWAKLASHASTLLSNVVSPVT